MSTSKYFIQRLTSAMSTVRILKQGCSVLNRTLPVVRLNQAGREGCRFTHIVENRLMCTTANKFEVINIQDQEDFKKRVMDASCSVPVVVDFHALWCGPCKLLGPRLESILAAGDGKVVLAKVDIDEHSELALEYGVRSVPTVVGVKNGKVHSQFVGLIDDDQIGSFVDKLTIS